MNELEQLFTSRGDSWYAGEPVTQTEHALQCAWLAEQHGATPSLTVAALLHDIGHLLHDFEEDCARQGIDDHHERLGGAWLAERFEPAVCAPVALHVTAKRYRCAVDNSYYDRLSAASRLSLELQGGPLTAAEVERFENHTYFQDALQLRGWDEAAKVAGLETPPLAHFLAIAQQVQFNHTN